MIETRCDDAKPSDEVILTVIKAFYYEKNYDNLILQDENGGNLRFSIFFLIFC